MLELLRIKNFALIEDLELEFHSGLNVFTGETGAGKSLVVNAISGLLGGNWQHKEVRLGAEKAWLEGVFVLEEEEYILRREYLPKRSRFYINDQLVSSVKIEELSKKFLLSATQHAQQKLLKPGFATTLVDSFLDEEILAKKESLLKKLEAIKEEKEVILNKIKELEQKKDYLEYQKEEIEKVNPLPGEEEELLARIEQIKKEKNIQEKVEFLLSLLGEGNLYKEFKAVLEALGELSNLDEFAPDLEKAQDFFYFLEELELKLRKLELVPLSEIDKIESRLYELASLKRKFKGSLQDILALKSEIEKNLSFLDESKLLLKELELREEEVKQELARVLTQINELRLNKSREIKAILEKELKELGFSAELSLYFARDSYFWFGELEEVRLKLLWQPNPGQEPRPLNQIASGGELSRLLLVIMILQGGEKGTLIFDEVDTGIGGLTLVKVGEKIKLLASTQQIILITHWPQLAVLADRHFKVEKKIEENTTRIGCQLLKQEEEIKKELARMAGGGKEGELLALNLWQKRKR